MIWLIWLAFIIADSIFHWWLIERKNISPNHTLAAAYRIVVAYGLYHYLGVHSRETFWFFMVGSFTSFWMLFNILLNKWRDKPIDHLGKSILDVIEAKYPFILIFFWKAAVTAGMVYGYFHPYLLYANHWD